MSKVHTILATALAVAAFSPLARAADSVTLTPSLVTATAVGGGALPTAPPTVFQGNTLYIYGSAEAAVYTINFSALANLASGEGFGGVSANFTTSAGITIPGTPYTPNNSSVWTFTLPGNNTETINNTYNGTNLVATIGGYTSALDPTRAAFAQTVSAPVGQMQFQWDGVTNNATIKLNDTTGNNVLNQIQYTTDNLSTGVLSGGLASGGQIDVQFIAPLAGDTDLNGTVSNGDLGTLLRHYNTSGNTWSTGDFNGDGVVNNSDLGQLLRNYNQSWTTGLSPAAAGSVTPAAAPEPASLTLLGVAGCALLAKRNKRISK